MTSPVGSRHRVRLGDQVYEWDEADTGRGGRPALVTQVGRSSQDQHPEVPVLPDHGGTGHQRQRRR